MRFKLNLIIFISLLLIGFLTTIYTKIKIAQDQKLLKQQIASLELTIKEEYKNRLKENLKNTISFIDTLYKSRYKDKKEFDEKEFTSIIRKYLYKNLLDKKRYIWVNKVFDFKGGDNYAIRLIHPNLKETEGSFLSTKTEDIKGNLPYLEELEGINTKGEIYFTYYFKEINSNEVTKKLSYAKFYKPFNWILVTGIPLNELDKIIADEKKKLLKYCEINHDELIVFNIFIFSIFIILILFLRKVIIELILKNLKYYKKYQEAIEVTEDGIWEYYPIPNKIHFNKSWKEMLGYKTDEIEDKITAWYNLIHPKDKEYVKKEFKKFIDAKIDKYRVEYRSLCKDGSYIWVLSRAKIVEKDAHGFNTKIIGIQTNINIRKNMDLELEEYRKDLESKVKDEAENNKKKDLQLLDQSKMASLGEMIGNIAHQWRQPLSVISTAASGIGFENETGVLTKEKIDYYVSNIMNSTKYLSETIDTFRNFLKEKKELTELVLQERINISLKITNDSLRNHNIKIINNINYDEPIIIIMVKGEFSQVVINLISNAKDILIEKKVLDPWVKLDLVKENKKVIFSIEDNGGGVPPNIISSIFEPYFTTKHGSIGTGLGLYMSYKIVTDSLKGKIYVENTEYGAKFFVELPYKNNLT